MDGYVTEPINLDELSTAIKAAISTQGTEPPTAWAILPQKEINIESRLEQVDGDSELLSELIEVFLFHPSLQGVLSFTIYIFMVSEFTRNKPV